MNLNVDVVATSRTVTVPMMMEVVGLLPNSVLVALSAGRGGLIVVVPKVGQGSTLVVSAAQGASLWNMLIVAPSVAVHMLLPLLK